MFKRATGKPIFKSKLQRIIFIVLAVVAVLVLAVVMGVNSYLKPVLTQKLKEGVLKATDSLYQVEFSDAELQVFRGKAALHHIVLKYDPSVYEAMKRAGKAPAGVYDLQVDELTVTGAKALKLFFNKKLEIGEIILADAKIQLNKYGNKPDTTKDSRTLYQKIEKDVKQVKVGGIKLDHVQFTYKDYTGKQTAVSVLKDINIKADELLIDSATQADTARTLFCRDITARLLNYKGRSNSGLYTYKVRSLTLQTRASRLTAAGIVLQPLPVQAYFAKSKADRFAFRLDSVTMNNFDFTVYYKNNGLNVTNMRIDGGFFEVFSNPNGQLQTTDRLVTFPHWAIRNLKTMLNVDTLRLKNIDVTYREYHKQSKSTGAIKFLNTTGSFINITNSKEALNRNNVCKAYLHSKFMGAAGFDLWFNFNLNDADYKYSYRGHLGPMNMQAANPAVMPLGMVQITSGKLQSFDFKVNSTQKTSNGQLKFLYNDLKVKLLRHDDEKGFTQKSLLSLFANSLMLKSNNPDEAGQSPRLATLTFIRPSNFPFFKTIWFTLLNGIKTSAMGKAPEADERTAKKIKKEREKAAKKAHKLKEKEDKKFKEKLEKGKQN